ncbi:MAG: hypothetical protein NZM25_07600 [Leptospiraceae bacterium]|nr:hypothetical protein [Leptospiraceae bacterium]
MKGLPLRFKNKIFLALPFAFPLISTSGILGQTPGWYPPSLLARQVTSYALAKDIETEELYWLTEEQGSSKNETQLVLYHPTMGRHVVETVARPKLQAKPSLAVCGKRVLITWQEVEESGSAIYWRYSAGDLTFGPKKKLATKKAAFLPKVVCDRQGYFYLTYQEERSRSTSLELRLAIGHLGEFSQSHSFTTIVPFAHRGSFLPFLLGGEAGCDIFFQVRLEKNLTDELFYTYANPKGLQEARNLTQNDYHDYVPYALRYAGQLEWVWQSYENKVWTVRYGGENIAEQRINVSSADAQNPSLIALDAKSRLIAWLDFRKVPPQIYAVFWGRDPSLPVSQNHAVTQKPLMPSYPQLVMAKDKAYLYYLSDQKLYRQQVDNFTGKVILSSKTHPRGEVRSSRRGEFFWDVQDETSGVESAGYLISTTPRKELPVLNIKPSQKKIVIENLPRGKNYFLFQYRDLAGNLSPVQSYPFVIDVELPTAVELVKATHPPDSIIPLRNAEFTLRAEDDSGIAGYYYALSQSPRFSLNRFSPDGKLSFKNLKPATYYLGLQAEDLAGNLSPVRIFRFQISERSKPATEIYFKERGQDLELIIEAEEEIESLRYSYLKRISHQRQKEFSLKGDILKENVYRFEIPLKEKYAIRFNVVFVDQNISPPYYYFPYHGWEQPKFAIPFSEKESSLSGILPRVRIEHKESSTLLFFEVDEKYRKWLKGFAFSFNEPLLEKEALVSQGQEVFLNLPQGEYFVEVKPLFQKKSLVGKKEKITFRVTKIPTLAAGGRMFELIVFFLTIFAGLGFWGRKYLRFQLSRFFGN